MEARPPHLDPGPAKGPTADPANGPTAGSADDPWRHRGHAVLLQGLLHRRLRPAGPARLLAIGTSAGPQLEVLASFGEVDAIGAVGATGAAAPDVTSLRDHPLVDRVLDGAVPDAEVVDRYDAVVALDVLADPASADATVAWIADHLKPGGVLVASVPTSVGGGRPRGDRGSERATLAELIATRLRVEWSSCFDSVRAPAAAAGRAVRQVRRRLPGTEAGDAASVDPSLPGPLEQVLDRVLVAEAERLARGRTAPVGLTAVCVARRPTQPDPVDGGSADDPTDHAGPGADPAAHDGPPPVRGDEEPATGAGARIDRTDATTDDRTDASTDATTDDGDDGDDGDDDGSDDPSR
jgi:SAM-dependent methyltransferase